MKRLAIVSVLAAGLICGFAASASADTVGDDLTTQPNLLLVAPPSTYIMAPVSAGAVYRFPQPGTVTAFSVRTFNIGTAPTVAFKIFRPTASADQYTVVSSSPSITAPLLATTPVTGLALPVAAGDTFGITATAGSPAFGLTDDSSTKIQKYLGSPLVGQPISFSPPEGFVRLTIQAQYTPSPVSPPAADTTPPTVSFTGIANGAKLGSVKSFGGTVASDAIKVELAAQQTAPAARGKKSAKKCRNLKGASGKLSKRGSCASTSLKFVAGSANGGGWRLTLRRSLPAGRYKAFARATDAAGNVGNAQVSFSVKSKRKKKR